MQRIAVSMIGGMISLTLLTLVVIAAIFGLVKGIGPLGGEGQERSGTIAASTIAAPPRVAEPTE
jgi:Cu(I)/Ag(I) efflux system membrane protein CusA/SilA